jgi:peptidoglycan/LPS O-acetylase OafA/YrhL
VVLMQSPALLERPEPLILDRLSLALSALGAALVVASTLYLKPLSKALSRRACRYLGRVSYSLYLVHTPVILLIAGHAVPTRTMSMLAVVAGCVLVSLVLATALERVVERPTQQMGRRMARWLDGRLRE